MKSISFALILLTWSSVRSEAPPVGNYFSSSYDDMPYQEESHGGHYGHSGHSGHSSAPAQHGNVEHEVIVQHHHYAPPAHATRLVTHGSQDAHSSPHYSSAPAAPHKHRGGGHSHGGHRHQHHRGHPSKNPAAYKAVEPEGSLYSGYASYKANDYKAYSMLTPSTHSDDYGLEAYTPTHTRDYGSSSPYLNMPSYKGAAHSYAPPGVGSPAYLTHSGGLSSYSGADHLDEPLVAYPRPKVVKHHHSSRAPAYPTYATKTASYSKQQPSYAVSKTPSYGAPSKYIPYSTKPSYTPTKSYSAPTKTYSNKNVYRAPASSPSKGYGSSVHYSNSGAYAAGAPSYSYGSPASKGFGYSYSQYDKPMEQKGYVRFGDESYGVPSHSHYDDDSSSSLAQGADDTENYGGGYADGSSSHY